MMNFFFHSHSSLNRNGFNNFNQCLDVFKNVKSRIIICYYFNVEIFICFFKKPLKHNCY